MAQVLLQARAAADVRQTMTWLTEHVSRASAARWHARVEAALESLANNPERCAVADEATDLGVDLRELLVGRRPHVYRILFTIDGNTVNVHRIRHAAQDRLGEGDV